MRERLQLEKAKKNKEKTTKTTQDPKVQKKRKNPKDSADQQKKKKKTRDQTQSDREMQQKEKEKEEKKQKKDEEQRRQKFLLEARKAQATKRWSSSNTEVTIVSPLSTSFRPEPLHRANRPLTHLASTSPHADHQTNHKPSADPTTQAQKAAETPGRINTCAQSNLPTTPAHHTDETPTRHIQSMHPTPCTSHQIDETPAIKSTSSKNSSEPRRGLHFQSSLVMTDSSENESDEECDATDLGSNASCCKQQKLENEALRKRLEKLHKRLNIACKSFKII